MREAIGLSGVEVIVTENCARAAGPLAVRLVIPDSDGSGDCDCVCDFGAVEITSRSKEWLAKCLRLAQAQ